MSTPSFQAKKIPRTLDYPWLCFELSTQFFDEPTFNHLNIGV